jgi:hypothetical protein
LPSNSARPPLQLVLMPGKGLRRKYQIEAKRCVLDVLHRAVDQHLGSGYERLTQQAISFVVEHSGRAEAVGMDNIETVHWCTELF